MLFNPNIGHNNFVKIFQCRKFRFSVDSALPLGPYHFYEVIYGKK
jgi:hypothetical protein